MKSRRASRILALLAAACLWTSEVEAGISYRSFDVPGGTDTEFFGINDRGDIAGSYLDSTGVRNGFILTGDNYQTFQIPGASSTHAFGINDRGQVVGVYRDAGGQHGFLRGSDGSY